MLINYNSKNFTITDELKDYFEKRIERINKYENLINSIEVYFSIDKYVNQVEVIIDFRKGKTVCFTGKDNDMYKAIDDVIDRIEKNVNKYKDRITNHKEVEGFKTIELKIKDKNLSDPRVEYIMVDNLYKKPLAIEDAIFLMQKETNKNYFFFYNYESLNFDVKNINFLLKEKENYILYQIIDKNNILKKYININNGKIDFNSQENIQLEVANIDDILNNYNKELSNNNKFNHKLFIDKNSERIVLLIHEKEKDFVIYL
jgi:putative sigma-54 modulation protein